MDITTQTEQTLIGSLLLAPEKLVHVADIVKSEDFREESARKSYLAMLGLWKDKKVIDLSSVAMCDMSLIAYLSSAIDDGLTFGIPDQAQRVKIQAKDRRIKEGLAEILNNSGSAETKLSEMLGLYNREIFTTSKNPNIQHVLSRFEDHVEINRKRGAMGVPTGFDFLEEKYIQYAPGHIWTIGGFTSTGKTAVMVQKVCNLISSTPCPSITIISTEMTEQQLISRIIANFTTIHSQRILVGKYRQGEEERVEEVKKLLKEKNLRIHDDIYTLSDIETVFKKAELQGGVDVGFIDYVQNCRVPEAKSQYQEQATLAKGIQKLAKDVSSTIICLSQVSNDVGRGNTDQYELKGAGEWAAVTDIGVMLQRSKKDKFALKYSVKKNRHGALVEYALEYKGDYTRLKAIRAIED